MITILWLALIALFLTFTLALVLAPLLRGGDLTARERAADDAEQMAFLERWEKEQRR
jgi:hypothetical protein